MIESIPFRCSFDVSAFLHSETQKRIQRENRLRFDAMDRKTDARIHSLGQSIDIRFAALEQKMDTQFRAILTAISESKAQTELSVVRMISALSERVAVLEEHIHR